MSAIIKNIQEDLIDFIDSNKSIDEIKCDEYISNNKKHINEIIYKILVSLSNIYRYHTVNLRDRVVNRIIIYLNHIIKYIIEVINNSKKVLNRITNYYKEELNKCNRITELYEGEYIDIKNKYVYYSSDNFIEYCENIIELKNIIDCGELDDLIEERRIVIKKLNNKDKLEKLKERERFHFANREDAVAQFNRQGIKYIDDDKNEYMNIYDDQFFNSEDYKIYKSLKKKMKELTRRKDKIIGLWSGCNDYKFTDYDALNFHIYFHRYLINRDTVYYLFEFNSKIISFFNSKNIFYREVIEDNFIVEDPVINIMREDDIDTFQDYISLNNLSVNKKVHEVDINNIFIYEDNIGCRDRFTLLELSCYYSATKIFKYILLNKNHNINELKICFELSLYTNNAEIIHILENEIKNNSIYNELALTICAKGFNNKIFEYILHKINKKDINKIRHNLYKRNMYNYIAEDILKDI